MNITHDNLQQANKKLDLMTHLDPVYSLKMNLPVNLQLRLLYHQQKLLSKINKHYRNQFTYWEDRHHRNSLHQEKKQAMIN